MIPEQYVGRVLDRRYHILEILAKGGMAWLFRAVHVGTGRALAVKVLNEEAPVDSEQVRRFQREARLTARLKHENIVDILDVQTHEECYLVMELLVGVDLGAWLRRAKRLPWSEVRAIMLQICEALQFAHEHGVVHRDLKPANCFRLESSGRIKVLDLGIAKPIAPLLDSGEPITRTGGTAGTFPYMAPEQFFGQVDARTDIYSAGVLMFELLTGRRPFHGPEPELLRQIVNAPMPPLASVAYDLDCPPGVEAVIARALAKLPEERYESMRAFAAAISASDIPPILSPADRVQAVAARPAEPAVEVATLAFASTSRRAVDTFDRTTNAIAPRARSAQPEPVAPPSVPASEPPAVTRPRSAAALPTIAPIASTPEPPTAISDQTADGASALDLNVRPPVPVTSIQQRRPARRAAAWILGFVACVVALVLWRRDLPEQPVDPRAAKSVLASSVARLVEPATPVVPAVDPVTIDPPAAPTTPHAQLPAATMRPANSEQNREQSPPKTTDAPPAATQKKQPSVSSATAKKQRWLQRAPDAVRNVLIKEGVGQLVSQTKVTVRWAASGEVTEATVHGLSPGPDRSRVEARLRSLKAPFGLNEPFSVEQTFKLPLPE